MDIKFHIGPRKCGKSKFVEDELSSLKSKLYIGTLPEIKKYQKTILNHRKRRNTTWQTYDIKYNHTIDVSNIYKALETGITACMLDGIITWYIFAKSNDINLNHKQFTSKLIRLVFAFPNVVWRFVDVHPSIFTNTEIDYTIFNEIHQLIINELNISSIIDWNYEHI